MSVKKEAGDEHMGEWVYCSQHVRPHTTGWCTVDPRNKTPLKATTYEDAKEEVRSMGLPIYGEEQR
jgi:hypothetical protein